MPTVNGNIQLGNKDGAWFSANPTLVLLLGQHVDLLGTGLYKLGDGVTDLQTLPFLGNPTVIQDGLQSGGEITVVTDDITVAPASWLISPDIYATLTDTDFLDIALSGAGNQRYIGFYGDNSNTIVKVEGAEAAIASYPTQPANTIIIGFVLVGDASISVLPDLSGYEEKVNKVNTIIGNETNPDTYPNVPSLYNWVTTFFATIASLAGYVKKGSITNNKILKGSGTDTATDSQISDDGSTVLIKGAFVADTANSSVKILKITDVNDLSLLEFNINGGLKIGIAAGNGATCADMVAIGYHAAASLGTTPTIGFGSVFLGAHAGEFSVAPSNGISIGEFAGKYSNADNNINIGTSAGAGTSLYTGANNVFISASAGEIITTGGSNIGIGYLALGKVTGSSFNIALGVGAGGYVNTYTGSQNISIGHNAGAEYSTATGNILIGHTAGTKISTGNNNVFIGEGIGTFTGSDTSGDNNLCVGQYTGYSLNSGNDNTLLGVHVGQYITTGSNNIFLGNNVSNGANKISTGSGNILIGYNLDTLTANPSNVFMVGSSLIIGKFDANPSNQELRFNATVESPLLKIIGTAGSGYIDFTAQSSDPSAPSSGIRRVFADANNRLSSISSTGTVIKYLASIIRNTTNSTAHTGNTNNTLLTADLIKANTIMVGDVMNLDVRNVYTGTAGTKINRSYFNTSASLSGATLVSTMQTGTTALHTDWGRILAVKASNTIEAFSALTSITPPYLINTSAPSSLTVDLTVDQYLITAGQLSVGTDTVLTSFVSLKR